MVAGVDTNGMVTLVAEGSAVVQASYGGFTSQMTVSNAAISAPLCVAFAKTNSAFMLSFLVSSGVTNTIETSADLITWTPLVSIVPTNNMAQFVDSNLLTAPRMFYRAVAR